jgi:hypothetical protein
MDPRNIAIARVKLKDVTDGTSKSLMISERAVGTGSGADTSVKSGFAVGVAMSKSTKPQLCLEYQCQLRRHLVHQSIPIGIHCRQQQFELLQLEDC